MDIQDPATYITGCWCKRVTGGAGPSHETHVCMHVIFQILKDRASYRAQKSETLEDTGHMTDT